MLFGMFVVTEADAIRASFNQGRTVGCVGDFRGAIRLNSRSGRHHAAVRVDKADAPVHFSGSWGET
jgi:hypothetical protein